MKLTGQERSSKKLKAIVFSYTTHKTAQGKGHVFWTYDLTTATEIRKSESAIRSARMKGDGHEYPKPMDIG